MPERFGGAHSCLSTLDSPYALSDCGDVVFHNAVGAQRRILAVHCFTVFTRQHALQYCRAPKNVAPKNGAPKNGAPKNGAPKNDPARTSPSTA